MASSAIDVAPVPDLYYDDPQDLILDLVKNAVVSLADAIALLTRELLRAHGSRVLGEGLYACDDPPPIL